MFRAGTEVRVDKGSARRDEARGSRHVVRQVHAKSFLHAGLKRQRCNGQQRLLSQQTSLHMPLLQLIRGFSAGACASAPLAQQLSCPHAATHLV